MRCSFCCRPVRRSNTLNPIFLAHANASRCQIIIAHAVDLLTINDHVNSGTMTPIPSSAAKVSAWYACDDLNLKTEGFWSAQVRDELSVSPTLCFGHRSFDCGRKPGGGVAGGAGARDSRGVRLGLDRRPRGGKSRSELYSGADAEP